jgi:protein-tyrosine phosphatase
MSVSKILPNLYLGDTDTARDPDFFKKYRIKAVLNCTKDIPFYFENIEYARVPIDDSLELKDINKFTKYIDFIVEFIHKSVDIDKKPILCHCYQGIQRSAAAVLLYLIKYRNMSYKDAKKFILDRRPEAFHDGNYVNFKKSIKDHFKK